MNYERVKYSRSKIEKAGKVIAKYADSTTEYNEYIPIVDNWRAAHALPLDKITMIVNNCLEASQGINVVQRLKRLDSIIGKLQRKNNTGLYRMQDLGGCRVIVPEIKDIYKIVDTLKNSLIHNGHEVYKEDDYLIKPREISGYRSYHMVVKYHEEDTSYDGMFVEIQVRTKLEHCWATAVEIMDATTNETLKVGTGKKEYMYFFKLVSALFSIAEETTIVDGIEKDKHKIVDEIYRIDKEESVREKLTAYNKAISFTGDYPLEADYFLLITDMRKRTISASPYRNSDINEAIVRYQYEESRKQINHCDVVLVAAKSFEIIRECYPNYFKDASAFLLRVNEFCSEYPEKSDITFSTNSRGIKLVDLFDIKKYGRNDLSFIELEDDGIGVADGDVVFCPDWAMTLDESYLRYTGIIYKNSKILNENKAKISLNKVIGPGIIILSTGASFIVKKESWGFLSRNDSIVIQCKQGVKTEWLEFLIAWIKSNVCMADLLCNRHAHSLFEARVFKTFALPNPDEKMLLHICGLVGKIIEGEKNFVMQFYEVATEKQMKFIEDFNQDMNEILYEIEKEFYNYYSLTQNDIKILNQELKLKGYYVYRETE